MLGLLILGILLISVFLKYTKLVVAGFCILFLVLGIWRHQVAEFKILNNELRKYNDLGKEIILIGIVSDEPDIRERSIKLTVSIEQLTVDNEIISVSGKILVTTNRYPEYQYGDKLKIIGKLETPPVFEGFNYKDYLKKDGIYSIINWPEVELIGNNFGSPIKKILFSFKNKFKGASQSFLSPPQEGILEALFFGDETNIPKEWKDKLNLTGTRHITAVSGMNITIIAFLILSFALSLGLWRQQAFYLSLFLLFLYIIMIGAPASAIRAGIMGGLLMIAQYFGRLSTASRAVVFAAFFMLLFNPLLLTLDVGFQLSFLAILGLIYFQPFLFSWLKKIPNPKVFPIRTTLSATLSAQFFTLPILIYNFGQISLASPLANILIVPILAPLTILIFVFGISGMLLYPIGLFLSWIAWLPLTYIIGIVGWFSKLSFTSLAVKNLHWFWLIISYLILGYLAYKLNQKRGLVISQI